MNKNGCRTLLFWAVCFTLPIAMLAVQSVWAGTYPFGAQSFLADDLRYQYIDFFTWYRSLLCGQGSIFYSFAQGMGSNTWGLYSYYLASPFNLVTLLFDQNHLTLAIYVIVALKLGCMQLAMTWYLKKRFSLSPAWALTLGLCYTWSTWTVTNLRNPLWLDALIILPLTAWCCHRLIIGGSFAPLAAIVAIDVITCWYMAYITLLFLCLFVLFELADHITSGARVSARWVADRAGRFTFAIVLGLLLSSWTFVPTVLAMLGGSGSSQISPLATTPHAILLGFLPSQWAPDAVPQFFAGIIPLVLSACFLLTPKVDCKFRLLSFACLAFMAASSIFGALQFVWCGMRVPNGFYSRTAFLFTFLLIWTAAHYLYARATAEKSEEETARRLVSPIAKNAALTALLLFACVDLGLNAHSAWEKIYYNYTQEQHNAYVEEADVQLAQIKQADTDPFYRFDKTYNRIGASFNEGISHGFNQLSSYSSANSPAAIRFLNSMGYSSVGEFSTVYASPVLAMDSLLGVRYVGAWGTPAGYRATGIETPSNGASISYNPYALSLGISVDANYSLAIPNGGNPFERQNALFSAITGSTVELYQKIDATQHDADGRLSWTVDVPANSIGYAYVVRGENAGSYSPVSFSVDGGPLIKEGWRFSNNVREVNSQIVESATTHTVNIDPFYEGGAVPAGTGCLFYALNMDEFTHIHDSLSQAQFVPNVFEDGHVCGIYTAARDTTLLLSIPYDKGWQARVDGSEVPISPAFDKGMSSIPVSTGSHTIELTYRSPGFTAGLLLTLVGCGAMAFIGIWTVRRRRRNDASPTASAPSLRS